MAPSLRGRTAIVTGAAGQGMGRSIALTLAREGANVVVNTLTDMDRAAAVVAHIEAEGAHALAIGADITQQEQCKALVDATIEAFDRVDICVIGPGAGWHMESIDALDSEGALDDVHKELAPIYHFMPLVLPGMYERNWGRLITIGLLPPYNSPAFAYNVAKASRTCAMQLACDAAWAQGVTMNTISPGPVYPIESLSLAVEQCRHGSAWQNRGTTSPQDIAEGVAFLCSKAGDYISGAVLPYKYR